MCLNFIVSGLFVFTIGLFIVPIASNVFITFPYVCYYLYFKGFLFFPASTCFLG